MNTILRTMGTGGQYEPVSVLKLGAVNNPDKTITTSTTDTKTTDKTSYLPLLIFIVIFAFIVYWIMK